MKSNTTGQNNVGVGEAVLFSNTTGSYNVAVGTRALLNNTESFNSAFGYQSLYANSTGKYNTAIGYRSMANNTTGQVNVSLGFESLLNNQTGTGNIAVGLRAGQNSLLSDNIFIGNPGTATDSGVTRIGTPAVQTSAYVAGVFGVTTGVSVGTTSVLIDSNGQLGTASSSRRYKEDINDLGDVSEILMGLRPVTFRYKKAFNDGSKPLQYGLIAEEVANVDPMLVVYNADGQVESVKYHLLPTLLLSEYQRQQRRIEDLEARLARLEALAAAAGLR